MVRSLMSWGSPQGAWNASDLALPAVDAGADPATQRWCVVAGGLALILSRLSATERSARFACTHALYLAARRDLRQHHTVSASPELLSEVMHEIADVADALTRTCLRACFQASLAQPVAEGQPAPQQEGTGSSQAPASAASRSPSGRPSAHGRTDGPGTGPSSELLLERSAALRRKLAAARSTGFADLK